MDSDGDDEVAALAETKIIPANIVPRVPSAAQPAARIAVDARLVADHPLVKMLLKDTGGLLLEVTRAKV